MIKNILKYFLAGVFIVSALFKMIDYNATVELFENLLTINRLLSKTLLSGLILTEFLIAYIVISDLIKYDLFFVGIIGLIFLFLISNMFFAFNGNKNCGCFGASIISSPVISIIKNIILLCGFYLLKQRTISIIIGRVGK